MLSPYLLFAQQIIPDSANGVVYKGAFDNIARGIINGNLIETNFRNHGEIARWGEYTLGCMA